MRALPGSDPGDLWSGEEVKATLEGALRAILATPLTSRDLPADVKSTWSWATAQQPGDYADEIVKVTRLRPSSIQINQAELVLPWIFFISNARDRRVTAARLCGVRWRLISAADGRSRRHLSQVVVPQALDQIAEALNEKREIEKKEVTQVTKFGI